MFYMHNACKIFKCFSHTTTLKVGTYRFASKDTIDKVFKYNNTNNTNNNNNTNKALLGAAEYLALVGAAESHAVPIKLNDKKVSIFNSNKKEIEPLTNKEFDELMKIVS